MDPVAQRNIGKRSRPPPLTLGGRGPTGPDISTTDLLKVLQSLDRFSDIKQTREQLSPADNAFYYYTNDDGIQNDEIPEVLLDLFDDASDSQDAGEREFYVTKKKRDVEHMQKRQLICPQHLSSTACFNNALKYYVRLFNTVHRRNS